jgi:hypothetical protein
MTGPALVILDGLAELTWVGFEPRQIAQFVRATFGLVRKVSKVSFESS